MITAEIQHTQVLTELPTYKKKNVGRKKRIGAIDFNPKTGRIAHVLGYCPECNAKVLADRESLDALKLEYRRSKKSLRYRIFMRLANYYKE
jgi:hypothetical protein